ncbi:serine/threonine-protein kinase [Actinomadura barringtoniae]|nr:serine/threonine-protein kinase [Actinomadura barringtoniae]
MQLPAELAERFELVAELPVQGAESDLLLVRDALAGEYVVKVFRRGYSADRDVWAKLPGLDSPHVVRILETGHAGGRDYEVTPYAPEGNLRGLMGGPLPVEVVVRVVAQLAEGLGDLHRAGVVHRDLKPENVLIVGADPLQLVITDFGLSKVLDQSVVYASSSRTLAYAAPESLSGQVSPARDWWSLGMIVRELLTGRAPFLGLSETAVVDHLATRAVPADDVADPRVRLLCQGLLTRDPRQRWGAEEVSEWLGGGSPRVVEEAAHPVAPEGAGLPFNGQRYTDRAELARVLIDQWDYAALYFFGRGESGEAWRSLREWLAEVPDDSRIGLIDGYLTTGLPADVKLLHLVRWLDPSLPPHFLGRRVTGDDLAGLAGQAQDASHPDHRTACLLGRELWDQNLLQVLVGFEGGRDLARVDDQWRSHVTAWNKLAGWLREHESTPPALAARLPDAGATDVKVAGTRGPVVADDPPVVLLTLLALAAKPAETRRSLAEAAARARAAVPERIAWFEWMAGAAGDDPLRLLTVVRAAPQAVAEAEGHARGRDAAKRESEALQEQWADRERRRLAGRNAAVARAVAWSLPLLAVWLFVSWLVGASGGDDSGTTKSVGGFQGGGGISFGVLAVLSVLAWAVQCGSEVVVARAQGKDYLPFGPWSWMSRLLGAGGRGLSKASQTMSGAAQRTGRRGCGLLLLAGIVPLLLILLLMAVLTSVASLLWTFMLVAVAAGHAVGAGVRLHWWRQAHEVAERDFGGTR